MAKILYFEGRSNSIQFFSFRREFKILKKSRFNRIDWQAIENKGDAFSRLLLSIGKKNLSKLSTGLFFWIRKYLFSPRSVRFSAKILIRNQKKKEFRNSNRFVIITDYTN